jgi:tetratricopeptide (TPR) repeat protein
MTLALNNLGMIYTLMETPRLDEAVAMVAKAIEVSPTVAEFRDSQGDILVACNRKADAVVSYDAAIKLGPEREGTRKKLIALLEELDQTERASEERETLAKLQKVLEERRIKMQEAQAAQNNAGTALPRPAIEDKGEPTPENGTQSEADSKPGPASTEPQGTETSPSR